jgi:hypothetical protein
MSDNEGILALICVVVGTILGIGGTMLTKWQDGLAERKKVRNRVIYYLLEIHHLLSKLKGPKPDIATIYSAYLLDRFGPEVVAELSNEVLARIQIQMESAIKSRVMTELLALQAKYPEALAALSEIDPIACYRLSGLATSFQQAEEFMTEYGKGLDEVIEASEMDDVKKFMGRMLTPSIVEDNLETIQDTLENMSKGPFNSKLAGRIKDILAVERQEEVLEEVRLMVSGTLDNYFDELLAGLAEGQDAEEE